MKLTTTRALSALVAIVATLVFAAACGQTAYCFSNCEAAAVDGGNLDVHIIINQNPDGASGSAGSAGSGGADGGACLPAADGREVCNGIDDDCDGLIDEPLSAPGPLPGGVDFTTIKSCGNCATDCTLTTQRVDTVKCIPPATLDGSTPGTCDYDACEQDFYDLNGNRQDGCEYYCPWNPSGTNTTDPGGDNCGRDDDCDGLVDEDVNTCDDVNNCGQCGYNCVIANGTPTCVTTRTDPSLPCDATNTQCQIAACNADFYDIDRNPANGCEYYCVPSGAEICNGIDDDCDGLIDFADPDLPTSDPNMGLPCYGGTQGECVDPIHQGVSKCIAGQITCCDVLSSNNPPTAGCDATSGPLVLHPDEQPEVCNGKDDNCDGQIDNSPIDVGGSCGSSLGDCQPGTNQCQNGALVCVGFGPGSAEQCDGRDNDCDGAIDGIVPKSNLTCSSDADCTSLGPYSHCVLQSPTDPNVKVCTAPAGCTSVANCLQGEVCLVASPTTPTTMVCALPAALPPTITNPSCDVPPPPPAPTAQCSTVTQPCQAGTFTCLGGAVVCVGSKKATSVSDTCCQDTNCDGVLSVNVDMQTDVANCGACGKDCRLLGAHGTWSCQSGTCVRSGCDTGFINCDSNANDCERACTFTSSTETCNGRDDNCDCQIDNIDFSITPKPSPIQVCGVSQYASETACTNATVNCTNGAWQCTFAAGYCNGGTPASCATTSELCDGLDNNCNGAIDETFKSPYLTNGYLGQACQTPASDGACRGSGNYVCSADGKSTTCNATKNLNAVTPELCDGLDNDCDGSIDEPYSAKGTNATYWVKPTVTKIGASLWVYSYEASRAGATSGDPGHGNGYYTSAPSGETLDKTVACSVPSVVPWFNVTPTEAEQTCAARGGRLCNLADWQLACSIAVNVFCKWGYNPRSTACTTTQTSTKYCNLGLFDIDTATAGVQNGLLPTASNRLQNCWADWSGLQGNTTATQSIFDITGNLREATKNGSSYTLMGGSYESQDENGASCDFTFYSVDATFKLFDTGFRCCFDTNPS